MSALLIIVVAWIAVSMAIAAFASAFTRAAARSDADERRMVAGARRVAARNRGDRISVPEFVRERVLVPGSAMHEPLV